MEVRPGYKLTEVGVIPEDWERHPISEIAQVDPENLPASTDPNYSFYYISLEQVDAGQLLSSSQEVFRTAPSRARRVLRHNDVLMSTVRPNLKAHLHFRSQVPNAICSTGFAVLRVKPGKANPAYIFAHLFAYAVNRQIEKTLAGSNYPAINSSDVRGLVIPCPPTETEQCTIAAALSDVDALLDGLDRLIAKKRNLKRAAMQQILSGQTRLPGFHGKWEVKRLREAGNIRSGGTPSTTQPQFWDGDVPWCTPTDITGLLRRKYLIETARTITAAGLKASSAEIIPPRSLIMTSRATIGECAINLVALTTNQGFKNIVPFPEIDVEFLYYLMTTQKAGLISLCGGSTFLEIGKKQLGAYEITLPKDRGEQTAIAAVLSDMDAELAALEARRDKTRLLKQAMMQELLTGRTRLV